jgi:hypothetical protein
MSTLEKQMDLMKRIPHIANESILDAIYDIINSEDEDNVQFTKEQEEQVYRALKQVKDGQTHSHEDVSKEVKQWLEG